MAVTIDDFSAGGSGTNARVLNTTVTANSNTNNGGFQTVGAGCTFMLVAAVFQFDPAVSGSNVLTWDATGTPQAMTPIASPTYNTNLGQQVQMFGLVNPNAGNNTLQITNSGNSVGNFGTQLLGVAFKGTSTVSVAAASGAYAANTDGGSQSATASVSSAAPVASGDMAIAQYFLGTGGAGFPTGGGTEIDDAFSQTRDYESYSGAGSTVNASFASGTSQFWSALIVAIKAPAAGPVLKPFGVQGMASNEW